MIDDITFAGVAWNEEARAPTLMKLARRHFSHITVAVQASTDRTLEIVRSIANRDTDRVLEHIHYGAGDFSFGAILKAVSTPWAFVVSFDEMPSQKLLNSLPSAVKHAEDLQADGVWIRFRSSIEGVEYEEQHSHLRLFRSHLRWPAALHSRPAPRKEINWDLGHIRHDRSLDEMVLDYLRYYQLGKHDKGWTRHNLMMMREACRAVAARDGWRGITLYPWWPEVRALAFEGVDPW